MEPLRKRKLLEHVKNEYLGAVLAAKVARRLHAIPPSEREDPTAKVTSLALTLISRGQVEFETTEPSEDEPAEQANEEETADSDTESEA